MRKLSLLLIIFMSILVLGLMNPSASMAENRSVLPLLGVMTQSAHLEIKRPEPFGPPKPNEFQFASFSKPQVETIETHSLVVVPINTLADKDKLMPMESLGTLTMVAALPQSIRAPHWIQEGEMINIERKSPQALSVGDKMKFVATLVNHTDTRLNLVAQVVVRKGDGSEETLIPNYGLQLGQGKSFRVPVGMAAREKRFPPGITKFIAFLRDKQGQLIDEASITFMIALPFD